MDGRFNITREERLYLRDLAKQYLEYANLPVMEERKKLWYDHNALKGSRPIIVMEVSTFEGEIAPQLKCTTSAAREIEYNLRLPIINQDLIDDDKVISPYYTVYWNIGLKEFDMEVKTIHATDSSGRNVGYVWQHPISDLKRDLSLLKPSVFSVDRESTIAWKEFVEEIIGDILPVKIKNNSLQWYAALSAKVVSLMGLEKMLFSMIDYPSELHGLLNFIKNDILSYVKWQEREGLLALNNGNDYAGAGSYGFTHELPTEAYKQTSKVTAKDLWLNMNSQETIAISPEMYGEFIFPYYYDIANEFGLVYYGCCEPVHSIWEKYVSKYPNIRKVSISPWCDENYMADALRGSNVIFSRKPSPNYIGVGNFDEDAFIEHIVQTLNVAKGCNLEIIFRDIYTLVGDINKPGKAVKIVRNLIDKMW